MFANVFSVYRKSLDSYEPGMLLLLLLLLCDVLLLRVLLMERKKLSKLRFYVIVIVFLVHKYQISQIKRYNCLEVYFTFCTECIADLDKLNLASWFGFRF